MGRSALADAGELGSARRDRSNQPVRFPWATSLVVTGRPTVGDLMSLCEENYRLLLRLAPELKSLRGEHRSTVLGGLDLHLEVLEQTPYTTLLRLTHYFPYDDGKVHRLTQPDPDALLRAYHDAGQVEVVDLLQTALPIHGHYRHPALLAKWRVNLFLAKWLAYCVRQSHRFVTQAAGAAQSAVLGR